MLEFLNNIILLPWNIFKVIWIYMFSIFVWYGIVEICRHYRPWEYIIERWKIKR